MRWTETELEEYQARRHYNPRGTVAQDADPGPESKLQKKIVKWAKDHGYPVLSFPQTPKIKRILPPGWPDICLVYKNCVIWMELKGGKGRLSKDQISTKMQFMALGHEIIEIRSFKAFISHVTALKP